MPSCALQSNDIVNKRTYVTLVLAMSADGKISDSYRTAARFPSIADKTHLEQQVATADATLFGAGTLRAYGTTALIKDPVLLEKRHQQQHPPQPIQIVCSPSGNLDANAQFFSQPVTRWLLTTATGAENWGNKKGFEKIWIAPTVETSKRFNWLQILTELKISNIHRLLVMGGGQLVSALMALDLIDELWMTICPLIIGGAQAPTPCDGEGFLLRNAPRFTLISNQTVGDEVFLNYRRQR
ncbi:MAG: RibD family protein [Leptolyngbya sp. SIO3F4]|nr:RibD family protein [Leptolyngbya sp. SIO3F4]